MGNLKLKRKLDPFRVMTAKRTERAKHEMAMQMVHERVKTDAEFAAKVLEIGGEHLREKIKKDATETVNREKEVIMDKSTIPADMKAVPVEVPISVADVPKEELQAALRQLSKNQAQRLSEAKLTLNDVLKEISEADMSMASPLPVLTMNAEKAILEAENSQTKCCGNGCGCHSS